MEKFAGLPHISETQPERLIKYRVSEDGFAAEVLLPGFAYRFDQTVGGKMNPWSLTSLLQLVNYEVIFRGFGHLDRLKDDEHTIFMAGEVHHVTDTGNQLNTFFLWGIHFPMHVSLNMKYVGTSAFTYQVTVKEMKTGDTLFDAYCTGVYVNYKTRKPTPFPDWYNNLTKFQTFGGPPQPRLQTPTIPPNACFIETKSTYSDIDEYNDHVNQSVYVKWCTDAGTEAALKGHYAGFTANIKKYPLESFEVKYIGEGIVDEKFVVHTWQDVAAPLTLHFVITKNGQIIIVAMFTYKSATVSML